MRTTVPHSLPPRLVLAAVLVCGSALLVLLALVAPFVYSLWRTFDGALRAYPGVAQLGVLIVAAGCITALFSGLLALIRRARVVRVGEVPIDVAQLDYGGREALAAWVAGRQVEALANLQNYSVSIQPSTSVPSLLSPPDAPQSALAMPAHLWLSALNDRPDDYPHLGATGGTGSGKTTFLTALLSQRAGQLVVCTVKGAATDPWGGLPVVRLGPGLSYAPMAEAITAVYEEMKRRYDQDVPDPAWLTLVLDDYSQLVGEIPAVRDLVVRIAGLGRGKRVRLVIADTELNVKAWGLEGRSDARGNFLFTEHTPGTRAVVMGRRDARGAWVGEPQVLDTSAVPDLARAAQLGQRAWPQLTALPPTQRIAPPRAAPPTLPLAEPTQEEAIILFLQYAPEPQTGQQIAAATQIPVEQVWKLVNGLAGAGRIRRHGKPRSYTYSA